MCVIIICEKERVTHETLAAAHMANGDGLGIAWVAKGGVRWRKGLSLAACWGLAKALTLPYVIHARLATVGGDDQKLTHPFPIERSPDLSLKGRSAAGVLFHNGHFHEWRAILSATGMPTLPRNAKGWSDSRAIAHVVAVSGAGILRELSDSHRFALLTPKGLHRFGNWIFRDRVLLSSLPVVTMPKAYSVASHAPFDWDWTDTDRDWVASLDRFDRRCNRSRYTREDGRLVRYDTDGTRVQVYPQAFAPAVARALRNATATDDTEEAEAMEVAEVAQIDRSPQVSDLLGDGD